METGKEPIATGVLLVHGIGAQRRGDTLIDAGNAISKCLDGLLQFDGTQVQFTDASLAAASPDEPPQATLRFRDESRFSTHTWKVAESHWADEFPAPGYIQFVSWALRVVPIVVLLHLAPRVRAAFDIARLGVDANKKDVDEVRLWDSFLRMLQIADPSLIADDVPLNKVFEKLVSILLRALVLLLLMPLFVLCAVLVQVLLLLFILVAWLPFGFMRSFARWVQLRLSHTLGDSHVFTSNPIIEAVVVSKVRRDIEWLARSCEQLVVVAHSQGAAVAHQAIEQMHLLGRVPAQLKLFITYGSGLQKLMDLRIGPRNARIVRRLTWLCQLFAIGIAGLGLHLWSKPPIALVVADIVGILLLVISTAVVLYLIITQLGARAKRPAVAWENYYASSDPVSNGPTWVAEDANLTNEELEERLKDQRVVSNFESAFKDHTTYWQNIDEFVARLVVRIMRFSKIPLHSTTDEWLKLAGARRRWRVGLLGSCRTSAMLMAGSVIFWPQSATREMGGLVARRTEQMREWLAAKLGPLADLLTPEGVLKSLAAWWKTTFDSELIAGGAVFISCVVALYWLATLGWRVVNNRDMSHFYLRMGFRVSWPGWAIFVLGWWSMLLLPVAFSLVMSRFDPLWLLAYGLSACVLFLSGAWHVLGKSPSGSAEWGDHLLTSGEEILAKNPTPTADQIEDARFRLRAAALILEQPKRVASRLRALIGWEKALSLVQPPRPKEIVQLQKLLLVARRQLERRGENNAAAQALNDRVDTLLVDPVLSPVAQPRAG